MVFILFGVNTRGAWITQQGVPAPPCLSRGAVSACRTFLPSEFAQVVGELCGAEVRAAHGAVLPIGMACLLKIL